MKNIITELAFQNDVDVIGFAPKERFDALPPEVNPFSIFPEGKTVIMTVCRRSEAIRLRKKVYEVDPGAFVIITKTSEIMGKGFRDNTN